MGSHTEVWKKLKPNLWRGRTEPCHNTKTSNKVTRTTEAANKKVIVRHVFCCGSCRGSQAGKVCLDEGARRVFHATVSHVVLDRVDQLNVAERIGSLLNHAGHAFIAFLT